MSETVKYEKACSCEASATCGKIVLSYPEVEVGDPMRIVATVHPGPVCDNCETPWARIGDGFLRVRVGKPSKEDILKDTYTGV
jgi:hypothetical protein